MLSLQNTLHEQFPKENEYRIEKASTLFVDAMDKINTDQDKCLDNLRHLSNTRFAVTVAANVIQDIFIEKTIDLKGFHTQLLKSMLDLFENCVSDHVR